MYGRSLSSRAGRGVGALSLAAATGALLFIAGPLQAGPGTIPAGNLVQNPGFEAGPGGVDDNTVPPTVWASSGKPSVWMYGTLGDRPGKDVATKIGGGANFLSGGQGGGAPGPLTATASQAIDVSRAAVEIDAGGVAAKLSAYLGGYTAAEDTARVDVRFLGADGAALGSVRVGPVTPEQRARQTTLLLRSAQALVPKLTRSVAVIVTMSAADAFSKLTGFADNISLVLAPATSTPPAAAKTTLAVACSGKTLVATVRPASNLVVKSVTFLVNGKPVAVDKKAPFTARIATKGLAAQLKVTARLDLGGRKVLVTKAIKRC